jgi:oligoendopeptidase F
MSSLPRRNELPKEQTWDLESLFKDETAWRQALAEARQAVEELRPFAGRLNESPKTLLQALKTRDRVMLQAQKVYLYANLQQATDGTNPVFQAMNAEARGLLSFVGSAAAYLEPELLELPEELLERWMAEEPELAIYRHYFDQLQSRRGHIRSQEVEALLAQMGDPLGALQASAQAATNADMRFAPVGELPVSHSTIGELLTHPQREVRRAAWESYADGHLALKNTLASCLQGHMKATIVQARARAYPSALEMSLSLNHIPRRVYDTLLAVFQEHLPLWQRYFSLRRQALGSLATFDVPTYDAPAPLRPSPKIPFAQAAELICRGMEPLGQEYVIPLRRGLFEERWVDWGQNQGKRAGAFSSGLQGTHPFVFMSYSEDIFSLSTLAHELGHSMHSYFSRNLQPYVYSRYSLFVAEVASNFNQAMVRAYLKHALPPEHHLVLLEEAFANLHRYLFVMPTLARFELECYERLEQGSSLSAPWMIDRLAERFQEGYGAAVEVDRERLGASWMMFSHFYQPFYVYQYATGISAANALAQKVLREGEPAAQRYLEFLKLGDSVYPLEALRVAGIDMETPQPIEAAFGVLEGMVDEFETLIRG